MRPSAIKKRALELGLTVLQPPSFQALAAHEAMRGCELDALVVVAYGLILPRAALDLPKLGCFNIHASLLPRWRGAAPIQRALLSGDAFSGVTIMRMEAGLDSGPVLLWRTVAIEAAETAGTLHDRLAALGGELICETLDGLAAGALHETPQPAAGITYAAKISKHEALIDWREDAKDIVRRVRAFNPSPVAETRLMGQQVRIWDAEQKPAITPGAAPGSVLSASSSGIDVACGKGTALRISRLQLAGRRALSAADFLSARPLSGARFTNQ